MIAEAEDLFHPDLANRSPDAIKIANCAYASCTASSALVGVGAAVEDDDDDVTDVLGSVLEAALEVETTLDVLVVELSVELDVHAPQLEQTSTAMKSVGVVRLCWRACVYVNVRGSECMCIRVWM